MIKKLLQKLFPKLYPQKESVKTIKEFKLHHISLNGVDKETGCISIGIGGYIESKKEEKC